jgi:hypothetical protein
MTQLTSFLQKFPNCRNNFELIGVPQRISRLAFRLILENLFVGLFLQCLMEAAYIIYKLLLRSCPTLIVALHHHCDCCFELFKGFAGLGCQG